MAIFTLTYVARTANTITYRFESNDKKYQLAFADLMKAQRPDLQAEKEAITTTLLFRIDEDFPSLTFLNIMSVNGNLITSKIQKTVGIGGY